MSAGGGTRAIIAALLANAGIALAKFVAYLVTGSAAMLAESIHSVADTANQGLLLLGGRQSRRVADQDHQFGYGRERYFWSFVVALVLFSLGGLYSIYEGISKILHPHELTSIGWAFAVLLVAVALESFSFRTAVGEARKVKGEREWVEYVRTSRSPELPVVLLEDAGALLGLCLALIGLGLYVVTGDVIWDAIGTLCIGTLLLIIATFLSVEMKSLLIGEAALEEHIMAIDQVLLASPHVRRVIDLRTQHLGPEELLVAAKIEFTETLTTPQVAAAIDVAEAAIRRALPYASRIYLEPDVWKDGHVPTPDAAQGTGEAAQQ
ncbi:MAG TPA: cation diffusion facilitator family transporter [Acidimicrobiia bacterium]|nr:cation diffusion facilitator family transporter [Acidimicrobiia bacterium]